MATPASPLTPPKKARSPATPMVRTFPAGHGPSSFCGDYSGIALQPLISALAYLKPQTSKKTAAANASAKTSQYSIGSEAREIELPPADASPIKSARIIPRTKRTAIRIGKISNSIPLIFALGNRRFRVAPCQIQERKCTGPEIKASSGARARRVRCMRVRKTN